MQNPLTRDVLVLAAVPGVGHRRLRTLVDRFGSASAVLTANLAQLLTTEGLDTATAHRIADRTDACEKFADEQIERMARCGANLLTYWDDRYPERLRQIYDAPAFLFVVGDLEPADEKSVAIVGTRKCTPYGRQMAERLASDLALRGITVVSGLARGIDTAAHQSALKAGGRTLAVLGSGVDRIYPTENAALASTVGNQGAIISDYPMGTEPDAVNFPNRNRIISGLSLGVVVVEAPSKSGALITTRFALEQNREVFAVPGQVGVPQAEGPNALIKSGAKLVETIDDIVEEIVMLAGGSVQVANRPAYQFKLEEQAVYDCLSAMPAHVEQVSAGAGMPVTEALSHLLALELQGAVRQVSGKHYIRT